VDLLQTDGRAIGPSGFTKNGLPNLDHIVGPGSQRRKKEKEEEAKAIECGVWATCIEQPPLLTTGLASRSLSRVMLHRVEELLVPQETERAPLRIRFE